MNRASRRSSAPPARALGTLALPLAALALAGASAWLLWSSLRGRDAGEAAALGEGMRGIPVAAVDLPAYTEIQLEHLIDSRTGQLAAIVLPEDSLLDSTVVDPKELVGRVLARRKSAARVFHENDFLPIGTRPGLVAGIPSGKRALRIDAAKVSGLAGLHQGDRFDLVATYRGDPRSGGVSSIYGGNAQVSAIQSVRSRLISENAAVVTALANRTLPVPGRSEQIVQEIVIALEPAEVPLVTEALEIAKRIDCIPRSGLAGGDGSEGADSQHAASREVRADDEPIIDLIEGEHRSLRRVPHDRIDASGAAPHASQLPPVGSGPRLSRPEAIETGRAGTMVDAPSTDRR